MPYIKQEARDRVDQTGEAEDAGEVNYIISQTVANILRDNGTSYNTIAILVSALECAKLELYRRIAAPYEDKKIVENGDIYESD